jgi:hypothetical protein
MAIFYPRTLPSVPIKSSRFGLNINQAVFESSLSRKVTIQNHAAGLTDRWEGVFSTTELSLDQVSEFSAWLVSLKGREKHFYAFDPDRKAPRGTSESQTSAPLVNGEGQVGNAVNSDGWQSSQVGLLMPGDYIQIGAGFHMIMEQVNSDALGNATINIEPVMRVSPADNAAIVFENPVLVARLGVVVEGWETGANKTGSVSFSWEEVI